MIKLGEFRKKKMSFKEWLESEKKEGFFRVTTLFPPNKYQSYTLIFFSGDVEVRLSIKTEKFRKAMFMKGIDIGKKRNIPSILVIIEKDFYGIDIDVDNTYQLVWKGTHWKLKKEVDDIPF